MSFYKVMKVIDWDLLAKDVSARVGKKCHRTYVKAVYQGLAQSRKVTEAIEAALATEEQDDGHYDGREEKLSEGN